MDEIPKSEPQFQYLGKKTFWIFVFERSGASILLLFAAIGLFAAGVGGVAPKVGSYAVNLEALGLIALIAFIVFFGLAFLIAWLVYANYRYCLDIDSLKVRRGILSKEEVAIPYRQIQNVDIRRSLMYQFFGLSEVVILTAGEENRNEDEGAGESEGILPALEKDVASRLQEELLRRADVQKVVATNLK